MNGPRSMIGQRVFGHLLQNSKMPSMFSLIQRGFLGTKSQPSRSHSASASTKGYIPNNQHSQTLHRPKQQDPDSILNNDKPNTKSNSNINKSCYINNNLREPLRTSTKKQVNADAQRESVNASEHARVDSHSVPGHDTSCSDSTHRQKAKESVTRNKPPVSTRVKSTKSKWDWQNLLGELAVLVYHWMAWVAEELGKVLWNVTKLIISIGLALLITLGQSSFVTISDIWITFSAKLFSFRSTPKKDHTSKKTLSHKGLKENIILPATGDEAMYRLLANKGKDPYSILGVRSDASDEVIKKYYRRQAVLVHPDKNQMPGAEEAFKILGHAFDLIGEPEKRRQFDTQTLESQEEEEAFYQFADLLNKLHEKMQEAANLMRCENCGGKHRRIPTERLLDSARFCQKCGYNHSVHEGDVWAESHMLGFRWNYYACMEGKVYDITEWASCQADRFQHIQANSHHIAYRIATQSNTSASRHRRTRSNEDELEDFLNQLFHQSSEPNKAGPASDGANFGQFGTSRPTSGTSNKPTNTAWSKKGRRRKKRH
ncbi:hypothetical protein LSH36_1258g00027 [Paralvinella palmiformis]|uniref:J domain-containing protein n=1 Tax=Paralvinella palmiformis TaxID=53620 RepID=A0AAD9IUV5_9ANNE|nr:hypothetical protein LSH36_1258g00027 [Paralvinella palmiformis]